MFPHNEAAIALYRKFGFVDEGRRVEHIRRADGELWDLIEMGLLLLAAVAVRFAERVRDEVERWCGKESAARTAARNGRFWALVFARNGHRSS